MTSKVQAKKSNAALLLGLIGTVATAGAAAYAIHNQIKQKKNKRDHQFAHAIAKMADPRTMLDNIFNDSIATAKERPVVKCALGQRYKHLQTESGKFRLQAELFCECASYLSLTDLVRLASVCKRWNAVISELKHDRMYLRPSAVRGFPDGPDGRTRGHCWKIASGSDVTIAKVRSSGKSLYQKLVNRDSKDAESIEKDVNRTLVHYQSFADEKTAERVLSNVLTAYSVHDSEVGYCQGMNFLAGFLLTKLPEEDAYWTLYTVMSSPHYTLRQFFLPDLRGLIVAKEQFKLLFRWFLPDLHAHFQANDVHSDVHTEWFMTVFTFSGFPRETAARIWDLFLVDGYVAIHRAALGILSRCQDALLLMDFEGILSYMKAIERDLIVLEPNGVIEASERFTVTPELLQRLERYHLREREREGPLAQQEPPVHHRDRDRDRDRAGEASANALDPMAALHAMIAAPGNVTQTAI